MPRARFNELSRNSRKPVRLLIEQCLCVSATLGSRRTSLQLLEVCARTETSQNERDEAVTVNGERYREMITDFCWPELDNMVVGNTWFQQDGATCHTANETLALVREKFPGRVISRRGHVNWPPRSCDLTPLDCFLWGYVKSRDYANHPATIHNLESNDIQTIAENQPDLCGRVFPNWVSRIASCN